MNDINLDFKKSQISINSKQSLDHNQDKRIVLNKIKQESAMSMYSQQMDEQTIAALEENQVKRGQREKVGLLLKRAQEKFKLNPLKMTEKFNIKFFKELKSLTTFVDCNQQVQSLNILNDVVTLRNIEYLNKNKQLIPKKKESIEFISDEKLMEDYKLRKLNFPSKKQMEKQGFLTIELLQEAPLVRLTSRKKKIVEQQEKNYKKLIFHSHSLVENISDAPETNYDVYLEKYIQSTLSHHQITNQPSENCFYSIQNKNMIEETQSRNQHKFKTYEKDEKSTLQNMTSEFINQLKNQYGIDVTSEQFQMKDVHKKYAENSEKLLKVIQNESVTKLKDIRKKKILLEGQKPIQKKKKVVLGNQNQFLKTLRNLSPILKLGLFAAPQSINSTRSPTVVNQFSPTFQTTKSKNEEFMKQLQDENKEYYTNSGFGVFSKAFENSGQRRSSLQLKLIELPKKNDTEEANKNMTRFITDIEDFEREFESERQNNDKKIDELNHDISRMQKRNDMYIKLGGMGFLIDGEQELKRNNVRQNQIQATKNIRFNRILKYY